MNEGSPSYERCTGSRVHACIFGFALKTHFYEYFHLEPTNKIIIVGRRRNRPHRLHEVTAGVEYWHESDWYVVGEVGGIMICIMVAPTIFHPGPMCLGLSTVLMWWVGLWGCLGRVGDFGLCDGFRLA